MDTKRARTIGLAVTLVLSVVAGASFAVAGQTTDETPAESDDSAAAQDGGDGQAVTIVEAMRAAENETNGTAVGARREGNFSIIDAEVNETGAEDETPAEEEPAEEEGDVTVDADNLSDLAYNVDVILDNGTQLEVSVAAENGSIVGTRVIEEGFLVDVFRDEQQVNDTLNLNAMRSGIEAVELARNETNATGTVTAVDLKERDDIGRTQNMLVYEVQIASADGERRTVLVAARPSVLGTESAETETATPGEVTETETPIAGDETETAAVGSE